MREMMRMKGQIGNVVVVMVDIFLCVGCEWMRGEVGKFYDGAKRVWMYW